MVKVLAVSNLYPNTAQPRHGIFTEHRLRWLARDPAVEELRVISPVPAFPLPGWSVGPYAHLSAIPKQETRHGIKVYYPRYLNIPGIGMSIQPDLMARTLIATMTDIQRDGFDFDVVDAFYFYPDAVASAIAAEHFGKPLVATAFGNDLSLIAAGSPRASRRILWAADKAVSCTAVCQALANFLIHRGVDAGKVHAVLHGVDLDLFRPAQDREALRDTLGISGPTLFTAGHLIERKGIRFAVEALKHLPEFSLLIAGDGPEEAALKSLAQECDVAHRVTFLGHVDQAALSDYYAASDAFVLMSSREGIANVVMESLACGTPVVATNVWGAPEIINHPDHGRLVADRSPAALAEAVHSLFASPPDRNKIRSYAETFTWSETTKAHLKAYSSFLEP